MTSLSRSERLAEHLDEAEADARFWENSHCLLFLARWVAREHPDFDLERHLGRCVGPVSAMRILRREGGIDAFVSREAARAGLARIDASSAQIGDIGLIRAPRNPRPGHLTFGCIRTSERWAIRALDGVVRLHVETIRMQPHLVWRV
ncbi:hypothetical protein [Methylopila sp. M107]|uniref:DUF6950 family protein n=1 Tax=Methylopila sp. M107 TaxID=1101190 RepID=UPI00035C6DCE|nr:hypothetical protein [Methylopila sp. M107]